MEDTVVQVATAILNDFPEEFDVRDAEKRYPVLYTESMNTVLTQELTRYNGLIRIIRSSLKDLRKAIAGEILLSQQLEVCMTNLYDGKIPVMWKSKSYPSLKPLGSYIIDAKSRLEFFQTWLDNGIPRFFWVNRFFFTQSFLTGALQNYARKTRIPIDELKFDFEVRLRNPNNSTR